MTPLQPLDIVLILLAAAFTLPFVAPRWIALALVPVYAVMGWRGGWIFWLGFATVLVWAAAYRVMQQRRTRP